VDDKVIRHTLELWKGVENLDWDDMQEQARKACVPANMRDPEGFESDAAPLSVCGLARRKRRPAGRRFLCTYRAYGTILNTMPSLFAPPYPVVP
jgi:hypothetical protein